jgi:fatty-acyl-CoA synthase
VRHNDINRVAVYAVPDGDAGEAIMAALVLNDRATLNPVSLEAFLAAQPDLSPKAWPRYVRVATDLPTTATHKIQEGIDCAGTERRERRAVAT